MHGGYPIIENNIIKNNAVAAGDASTRGGGIYFQSGIIRGNVIALNAASSGFGSATGGGIFKDFGEGCEIYNNTILQNNVYSYRGNASCAGICLCLGPSDAINIVENNIIAFNRSGGGVCISNRDSVWLGWDYNLVYGNEDGNFTPGPHDLQVDPMLVDTSSCDYHLQATSPCIDAGDPSFPLDPDSTRADIGAYFFDQAVDIDDPGPNEPYQFALSQNYPNPFNAQTTITYCLDKEATVSMSIYSITGQLMKIMVDKDIQGAGEHRYIWDGTDGIDKPVSTGIYFYELYVDGYKESKAMIMIK